MVIIEAAASPADTVRTSTVWDRARWTLLGIWALITLVAFVAGAKPSSYADLRAGLDSGRVHAVSVSRGLGATGNGYAVQQVRWREGLIAQQATVLEVRGQSRASVPADTRASASATLRLDAASDIAARHPSVRVVRTRSTDGMVGASYLGWEVPGWLGLVITVASLATLFLLVNGPQPWRATRWAWFWLLSVPWGPAIFLVMSGETPRLSRRRSDNRDHRRLRGGWALVLALVLGQALSF